MTRTGGGGRCSVLGGRVFFVAVEEGLPYKDWKKLRFLGDSPNDVEEEEKGGGCSAQPFDWF